MVWALAAAVFAAAAYQILAWIAVRRFANSVEHFPRRAIPISILKPIRGLDSAFAAAIRSHAEQRYAEFEILFGSADPNDPALAEVRKLQILYPHIPIRIIHATSAAPNGKVATLADLRREARYPILVVSDSDILVAPDYLEYVTAPLTEPRIGLVTCLYAADADSFPARFEALGVATDFAPSTLVARLLGVKEFAMGSTLAFRAADLDRIGGFEAIAEYLADDYQLGKKMTGIGLDVHLSRMTVETHLAAGSWSDVWRHQVRWARTIRVSRGLGYLGLPIANATFIAVLATMAGWWAVADLLIVLRLGVAISSAWAIQSRVAAAKWYLSPLRDMFGFAVWVAGLFGRHVVWRGLKLKLGADGRLQPLS